MTKHIPIWTCIVVLVVGTFQTAQSSNETECNQNSNNCILITECALAIVYANEKKIVELQKMICVADKNPLKVCCPPNDLIVFREEMTTSSTVISTTPGRPTTTLSTSTETEKATNENNKLNNSHSLPSTKICGISGSGNDRIYGGDNLAIDEFPWLVWINTSPKNNTNTLRCGGSLITDRFVLTAAHCVMNKSKIIVRLGEWDTETEQDCNEGICSDPPINLNVVEVIIHPSYNEKTVTNDISLLRLEKTVKFTDFVRPVCLPVTEYAVSQDYVTGTTFWAAGWGLTEYGTISIIKKKVELETVPIEDCQVIIKHLKNLNPQKVICAGGKIGKDSCNGDSGGPLLKEITENFRTNWYLYGITSFGTQGRCGGKDKPAIYTRVVSYMDWIIKSIKT